MSRRRLAAAITFLAALPVSALSQFVIGDDPALVMRLVLAVGTALMAVAVLTSERRDGLPVPGPRR